jgi:hypothetical protein
MDRKQGFFSALREEVARGLSPARARRRAEEAAAAKAALRYAGGGGGEALAPLMEGPDPEEAGGCDAAGRPRRDRDGWGRWVRGQLTRAPSAGPAPSGGGGGAARRNDLRMLLGVMGAALAPVHVCAAEPLPHLSIKDTPIVSARRCSLLCLLVLALDWIQSSAFVGEICEYNKSFCPFQFLIAEANFFSWN